MKLEFDAMRGTMGGEVYYVAMVQLKNVPALFETYLDRKEHQGKNRQAELDLRLDAQRRMNVRRIPEIASYVKTPKYVFNSITVNSEAELNFIPARKNSNLGTLHVENFSRFTVADGQHRLKGIREALKTTPADSPLLEESLAVVFFDVRDKSGQADIARKQQIFTDLNRSAMKVTGSLLAGMGNQPNEKIARRLVEEMPAFELHHLVEKERSSPTLGGPHLFSLHVIKQTVDIVLGENIARPSEAGFEQVQAVWNLLFECITPWQKIIDGGLQPDEVKREQVCCLAVVVRSLAYVAARILDLEPERAARAKQQLQSVNWRKRHRFFHGKILTDNGDGRYGSINNREAQRKFTKSLCVKIDIEDAAAV